jgi:uncharacterized membrane protein YdbT with pleckstrin-like domain
MRKSRIVMIIRPSFHGFFIKHYYLSTIFSAVLIVVGIVAISDPVLGIAALGAIGLGVFLILFGLLHAYANQKTAMLYISDEEVIFESGIISHSKRMVPLHMITDSHVHRGFIDRIIGISGMRINTSGTSGFEIDIDDFNYPDIEMMHNRIHKLIRKTPSSINKHEEGNHGLSKKN